MKTNEQPESTEQPLIDEEVVEQNPYKNIERFSADLTTGLTDIQVQARQQQKLINKEDTKSTKSYLQIFMGNIFTFFNMLCLGVFIALICVGRLQNTFFMGIILLNLLIGLVQEIKAKHTVEKISLITSPHATVLRGGKWQQIKTAEIVLDEIITYKLGSQICADSIIEEGTVDVNESLLTGESEPIRKTIGDTILSGSYIVSGSCIARADKVADQNYSAELTRKAKTLKKAKSEILRSLNIVIRSISIIIVPLAIGTFLKVFLWSDNSGDITNAIMKTAGSMIGMIPAGMFLLTSVALAVGIIKLAKKRTLVQNLYSIEMLARADVLCLDKTGTITDGSMTVKKTVPYNTNDRKLKNLMAIINGNLVTENQTADALNKYFGKNSEVKASAVMEFSSSKKFSAVTLEGSTYILGAAEFIMKDFPKDVKLVLDREVKKGSRVLMLAKAKGSIKNGNVPEGKREVAALIIIQDNIRPDAIETIKWFTKNKVEVKIISGDNAQAVSAISRHIKLPHADKFISLEGKTDREVYDAAGKYAVFGRVSPEQKCILVKALKEKGKKVAMTGDGVNDILALKEADCSVAMASGSEAVRNVSSLVMLDSNFGSMPSVVAEGRRVVNNISKSASLFLMKTFFTMFITVFTFFVPDGYPLSTNHILLIDFFVTGVPSFFLALQANNEPIKGDFITNLTVRAFPAALTLTINVILCYIALLVLPGMTADQLPTLISLMLTFTGFVILLKICWPFDKYRLFMFIGCLLGCILVIGLNHVIIPQSIFEYEALSKYQWLFLLSIIIVTSMPLLLGFSALVNKFAVWPKRKRANGQSN